MNPCLELDPVLGTMAADGQGSSLGGWAQLTLALMLQAGTVLSYSGLSDLNTRAAMGVRLAFPGGTWGTCCKWWAGAGQSKYPQVQITWRFGL